MVKKQKEEEPVETTETQEPAVQEPAVQEPAVETAPVFPLPIIVSGDEDRRRIGREIAQAREAYGWSQNALAATANVPLFAVSQVEVGSPVGEERINAMRGALKLDPVKVQRQPTRRKAAPEKVTGNRNARPIAVPTARTFTKSTYTTPTQVNLVAEVKRVVAILKPLDQATREQVLALAALIGD